MAALTAVNKIETGVKVIRLGAYDYVMKPFIVRDMLLIIECPSLGKVDNATESRNPSSSTCR